MGIYVLGALDASASLYMFDFHSMDHD